jgi:hypothetical protein
MLVTGCSSTPGLGALSTVAEPADRRHRGHIGRLGFWLAASDGNVFAF